MNRFDATEEIEKTAKVFKMHISRITRELNDLDSRFSFEFDNTKSFSFEGSFLHFDDKLINNMHGVIQLFNEPLYQQCYVRHELNINDFLSKYRNRLLFILPFASIKEYHFNSIDFEKWSGIHPIDNPERYRSFTPEPGSPEWLLRRENIPITNDDIYLFDREFLKKFGDYMNLILDNTSPMQ